MSRQRRVDAIARRRAFLDNQLEQLSNNEPRIPNIIRNRSGNTKPRPRPRYEPYFSGEEGVRGVANHVYVLPVNARSSINDQLVGASTQLQQPPPPEAVTSMLNIDPGSGEGAGVEGRPPEQIKLKGEEVVPIAISNMDIAEILAGTGSEELMRSLQTIQTEDGTVMVVLEGGDFGEGKQLAELMNQAVSSESVSSTYSNYVSFSGATTDTDSPPSTDESEQHQEVPGAGVEEQTCFIDENNESYVLVQTPEGPVLVPSSIYAQDIGTTTGSDEGITEFVAAEGGAIEQIIRKKKSTSINLIKPPVIRKLKRTYPPSSSCKVVPTMPVSIPLPVSAKIPHSSTEKSTVRKRKSTVSSLNTLMLSHKMDKSRYSTNIGRPAAPQLAEEKPRPFRFELPELDNNMNDLGQNFMSVPVPIGIDSLQSETDSRKTEEFKMESQYNNWKAATDSTNTQRQTEATENDLWKFKCITCSEVFSKESDLRLHSQESHVEAKKSVNACGNKNAASSSTITISPTSTKSESITTSSQPESQIALAQNQLMLLKDNVYAVKTLNMKGEDTTMHIQFTEFIDAEGMDIQPASKIAGIDNYLESQTANSANATKLFTVVDEGQNVVGRRTLNKASAKANMLSELSPSPRDCLEYQYGGESVLFLVEGKILNNAGDDDGQPNTIQSANIRARSDRTKTKALDQNGANEEEIGDNFQKIFLQMCSETNC